MLSEQSVIDQIEVTRNGCIQVRRADLILKDGEEVAKSFHRHVLAPGDDLSNEDQKVISIANAVWTSDVIAAYKSSLK